MRDDTPLRLIGEVSRLLTDAGIPHWLFGGWSVDFHAGAITREHGDVEFFIWEHDGPRAEERMRAAGYAWVDHPHPEEASIWRKDGLVVELYFIVRNARGEIDGRGRWANWPVPDTSLEAGLRELQGVRVPTVSAECILAVKEDYERHTGVPPRGRDRADIALLHEVIRGPARPV